MERAHFIIRKKDMKGNLLMESFKVKEYYITEMEMLIKGALIIIKNMVKVN